MLESSVEAGLREQVRKRGGLFLKFTSPGTGGVPDRVIIDRGRVIFVELKQAGEKPRKLQEKIIERMRGHGADVRVVAGRDEARALVKELWPDGAQQTYVSTAPVKEHWVKSYAIRAGARGAGLIPQRLIDGTFRHTFPPEDGRGNFIYEDDSIIREEDDDGV